MSPELEGRAVDLQRELAPIWPWGVTVVRLELEWRVAHELVRQGWDAPAAAADATRLGASGPDEMAGVRALTESLLLLQLSD